MASSEPSSSGGSSAFSSVHHLCQDPLQELARRTQAGSKRNALLLWCQSRVSGYRGVEVTNFSSSWNNGLALCALLHTYIPSEIPWNELVTPNGLPVDKKRCFEVAFRAAERDGIQTTLHLQDMLATERPDWNAVMSYVTSIYRRYEVPLGIASHSSTTNMSSNVSGVLS
ncbi:cytospin-A [Clonorchis sinensis]|nr:cytospin-A [Clonorchis sinensis]